MCGFIVKKILSKIHCETCHELLTQQNSARAKHHLFLSSVSRGKLLYASEDVFKVVVFIDKILKSLPLHSIRVEKIITLTYNNLIGTVFENHLSYLEKGEETHVLKLIKAIGYLYCKIKLHDIAKEKTIQLHSGALGLSNELEVSNSIFFRYF